MKYLVVDNYVLRTQPCDENSKNLFAAERCLEQNRKIIEEEKGKIRNDTGWMMKILPYIAKYFKVDRKELLQLWVEDYGLKTAGIDLG